MMPTRRRLLAIGLGALMARAGLARKARRSLFTHVMAFSPGFIASRRPSGRPRIFISHGRSDTILPIDVTSRRIVPRLEDAGYAVTYREFDGTHAVLRDIAQDAFKWFAR
jgi:predicted esterase